MDDDILGKQQKIDTSVCSANNSVAAGRSNDEMKVDNGSLFDDNLMLIQGSAWPTILDLQ